MALPGNAAGKGLMLRWLFQWGRLFGNPPQSPKERRGLRVRAGVPRLQEWGVHREPCWTPLGLSCWLLGCLCTPLRDAGTRHLGNFMLLFQPEEGGTWALLRGEAEAVALALTWLPGEREVSS